MDPLQREPRVQKLDLHSGMLEIDELTTEAKT
jgi:hypothetical protein